MSASLTATRTKLIMLPKKGLTKDGDVDFDVAWGVLATALQEIQTKNTSRLSFEELYRNVYKIVLKRKGDILYDHVRSFEETWLREQVRPRIVNLVTPVLILSALGETGETQSTDRRVAGERFLETLTDAFADHQICMKMITDVLIYMNKACCQDRQRPLIYTTAMMLFRQQALNTPLNDQCDLDILTILETVILDMIQMERKGEVIDRSLVRACVYMLEGLYESYTEEENTKLYLTSFEPKFLESSRIFYSKEGQQLLETADAGTFCSHARKRLAEEEERCQQTISPQTEPRIKSIIDKELIAAHIRGVINIEETGVKYMLDNDRYDDLNNVYGLTSRVDPRKTALKEAVQKRVVELGSEINKNALITQIVANSEAKGGDKTATERPINQQTAAAIRWVEDVLELKVKYDKILKKCFNNDTVMEKGLEVSFQDFINANLRSSEHLALFLDDHLKKGIKNKTDAEADALLDKGIILLQYISDKDLFETYYKKHLSKRLLMKKSASVEVEHQMISKMKMKVGNTFTQRLEAMFKDMSVSADLHTQYKDYVAKLGDPDPKRIDIEAFILTTTIWPFENLFKANDDGTSNHLACVLPAEIENVRKRFERFYLDKHSGRALSWQANMGTADIRTTFRRANGKVQRHELNVSTYAMVVLMLFQDLPSTQALTFDEIQARTNIPPNELARNLQSLAIAPKTRVLRKEPMSKDVTGTDKFYFNEEFTSNFVKVKIGVVAGTSNRVESNDEREKTKKRSDEERGIAVEAAIVRIMKQRKTLLHHQLMSETLQQLSSRFQPDVNMVKKKIEALIDREYLERGSNANKPSYKYLA